ncbi:MAG: electron transfer flavoprotein subunit alpha/FixB family protein [Deltaproteobacteria bacterium]|nr:electron transfer flavoprotein subunit alpha/FixB family protein [Deltaproteobacteria bacterium]
MKRNIWVVAHHQITEIKPVTFELLDMANRLAEQIDANVNTLLLGTSVASLSSQLIGLCDHVYIFEDPLLEEYHYETYQQIFIKMAEKYRPDILLVSSILRGTDCFPRLAAHFNAHYVAGCLDLSYDPSTELLTYHQAVYEGRAILEGTFKLDRMAVIMTRPHVFTPSKEKRHKETKVSILEISLSPIEFLTRRVSSIKTVHISLGEALVVVAGGRGMQGAGGFKLLWELARRLHGAVGATKAAVDAGWCEHRFQIGQTGSLISPEIYIACGISGSIHHLAGIQGAKTVIAINEDPNAPIFKRSDYGIVGNVFEVIPELIQEIDSL